MPAIVSNFRDGITLPQWRMLAQALNASASGVSWASDLRNNSDRHPFAYSYISAAILNAYSFKDDEHIAVINPGTGAFAAGCGAVFAPSIGPTGTISGGTSGTVFTLNALPNAGSIGLNQWGNRGDFTQDNGTVQGFKIRVIGLTSGKVEEVYVVANTSGTTPVLTVSPTLTFTPSANDKYELLSGSVMLLATGATIWQRYDIALNKMVALTATNLPAAATDTAMWVLDELYVPQGQAPGAGFFGVQGATASTNVTNATVTGTGGAADASLKANEYANFQIRITKDLTNPGAVGQRLPITSHTAATPTVYTLRGVWGTAPSNTYSYVVEGIGDVVVCTGASTTVGTYGGNFAADAAFSTNGTSAGGKLQVPVRAANSAAGMTGWWANGLAALDSQKNARYSACYLVRGGAVATIDCLDIATLSWTTGVGGQDIVYGNKGLTTFTTGTCSAYSPWGQQGQFTYINLSGTQQFMRWDNLNRILTPYCHLRYPQGAAVVGEKLFTGSYIDPTGTPKIGLLFHNLNTGSQMAGLLVSR